MSYGGYSCGDIYLPPILPFYTPPSTTPSSPHYTPTTTTPDPGKRVVPRGQQAAKIQRVVDHVRDCPEGQDVLERRELGRAGRRRSPSTEERRLPVVQVSGVLEHQPPTLDHRFAMSFPLFVMSFLIRCPRGFFITFCFMSFQFSHLHIIISCFMSFHLKFYVHLCFMSSGFHVLYISCTFRNDVL